MNVNNKGRSFQARKKQIKGITKRKERQQTFQKETGQSLKSSVEEMQKKHQSTH
jgi:hypothetical protein